ncbi:MAG: hypothetical protein LBK08_08765 [Treponema sp.]|jgi:hypothetical protein|nr:hypothetical protein [Treponema sp.]
MKKHLYQFIPIGLIISHIIITIIHIIFNVEYDSLFDFLFGSILFILFVFSILNIVIIILAKGKGKYLIHIGFETLRFCILHVIMALIISMIIWNRRDKVLIEITNIEYFNFATVFSHIFINALIISIVIILALNIKKSLKINKNIFMLLFPLKYIILFIFLFFAGGFETLCVWNPLIDTEYSDTFNVYNIDKIEKGMTEEHIRAVIGEPLYTNIDKEGIMHFTYTNDGKCNFDDYAWFDLQLEFKDNILVKKISRWNHD